MRTLAVALALLCTAVGLPAQQLVWQRLGTPDLDRMGGDVAVISDLDNDGWPELVHVVRAWSPITRASFEIWTLSGRTGDVVRTLPAVSGFTYDSLARAGDMDGDGFVDYAVRRRVLFAIPGNNIVEVHSGRDDSVIWSTQGPWIEIFGASLLGDIDLTGDGRPDLVLTAPHGSPMPPPGGWWGEIRAFDHAGNLLYRLPGSTDHPFGWHSSTNSLGKIGDLDGDGCDDFIAGGGSDTRGAAAVFSGRTGGVLVVAYGPRPGDNVGHSVAGCGDLDGDGAPDFAAGNDNGSRGVVATFSGASGRVLHTWSSEQFGVGFDGEDLASDGIDVDRDGVPDVIIGAVDFGIFAPGGGRGAALVLSGRDGALIHLERGSGAFGDFVTALGRRPGSPFPLYTISNPQYITAMRVGHRGQLIVMRGSPPGAQIYGAPCAGTLARPPKIGMRTTETAQTQITVFDAAPGTPAFLLLGVSRTALGSARLPLSLTSLGFTGCALHTSGEVALPTVTGTDGIRAGYATFELPALPVATGIALHAQWICTGSGLRAPGGVSDALEFHVP